MTTPPPGVLRRPCSPGRAARRGGPVAAHRPAMPTTRRRGLWNPLPFHSAVAGRVVHRARGGLGHRVRSTSERAGPPRKRRVGQLEQRLSTRGQRPIELQRASRPRCASSRTTPTLRSTRSLERSNMDTRRGMSRGANYSTQQATRDTTREQKAQVGRHKAPAITRSTGLRRRERRFESCRGTIRDLRL